MIDVLRADEVITFGREIAAGAHLRVLADDFPADPALAQSLARMLAALMPLTPAAAQAAELRFRLQSDAHLVQHRSKPLATDPD